MGLGEFKLVSTGIDIGTTTTQLIISELTLKNRFPGARIPKIEIVDKKIIYKSNIHFTPIINHKDVDAQAIKAIIVDEYNRAGYDFSKIDTGAVIITGETAKKENAKKILHEIADFAGDFVVAIAGPELESILAGKGSGASTLSKEGNSTVINLDIGGGTTNIAVFENGEVVESLCVNVGGRLVEIDKNSEIVTYISKPAKLFIDYYGLQIYENERINLSQLEDLCNKMVKVVDDISMGREIPPMLKDILMTNPIKKNYKYDGVVYSGGVAEYIYNFKDNKGYAHSDIGPMLGMAFKKSELSKNFKLLNPMQTIRATVVGAGTQTVNVSGSTVFINRDLLPIRNIPVAKVIWDAFPKNPDEIAEKITRIINRYETSSELNSLALSMPCPEELSFDNIEIMAKGIYTAWRSQRFYDKPLAILLEKDIAKVLGQTIHIISNGEMKFFSLDSVNINDGDYIDIGRPISKEDVVPVIIKTLVFSE